MVGDGLGRLFPEWRWILCYSAALEFRCFTVTGSSVVRGLMRLLGERLCDGCMPFLEESDAESVRRQHRRCTRELAARMSQSSGRDSADGTAGCFYSTQSLVGQSPWSGDLASQCEVSTVQALMDLGLPPFAGLGDGPRQVHGPW